MGMALDEPTDDLEMVENNGIQAYIDPKVKDYLKQFGDVKIDHVTRPEGGGYMITVGDPSSDCSEGGCSGCG